MPTPGREGWQTPCLSAPTCPLHTSKTHISSPPRPLSSGPGVPTERCTGKSAIPSLEQPHVSGSSHLTGGKGRKASGGEGLSPQQGWGGLTLLLFGSVKCFELQGQSW